MELGQYPAAEIPENTAAAIWYGQPPLFLLGASQNHAPVQ